MRQKEEAMEFKRSAGILLHPTSLPGKYGIGDLGKEAYSFIDFLDSAGQTLWQVLPLGPTGYGDSPYQCFSAFAGNPLLISPELLLDEGLLTKDDLNDIPESDSSKVDFGKVINYKYELLKKAFANFNKSGNSFEEECGKFCEENNFWLDDFALFMACKNHHGGVVWTEWESDIALRKKGAVEKWRDKLQDEIKFYKFIQYKFFSQWTNVKKYAGKKGIQIIGDIPIFIAFDSSDLWANKESFSVDSEGKLENVAGVPPDYFSKTGQLWGNPLYKWDIMEKDKFSWWLQRIEQMKKLVDIIRIDHFRGFQAYYEIPGDAKTAQHGRWIKAPGDKLFETIQKELGDVPVLAEDLGIITTPVRELRDKYNLPGMNILQFAFGPTGERRFLPHNLKRNSVVFTGSHDNDTTKGFFENEKKQKSEVYHHAQQYMNYYGPDICAELIRLAYSSIANIVMIPMQDILNLGTEARMNMPSKPDGNWNWRFTWDQIQGGLADKYKELVKMYDRSFKLIDESDDDLDVTYNEYL
ncbi:4-alpha-glucanotransferase [Bacteroidota bacterium]